MKVIAETNFQGLEMKVLEDLTLNCRNAGETNVTSFNKEFLSQLSKECRNINKLHKPIPLLFWQDVKNGKKSNWG